MSSGMLYKSSDESEDSDVEMACRTNSGQRDYHSDPSGRAVSALPPLPRNCSEGSWSGEVHGAGSHAQSLKGKRWPPKAARGRRSSPPSPTIPTCLFVKCPWVVLGISATWLFCCVALLVYTGVFSPLHRHHEAGLHEAGHAIQLPNGGRAKAIDRVVSLRLAGTGRMARFGVPRGMVSWAAFLDGCEARLQLDSISRITANGQDLSSLEDLKDGDVLTVYSDADAQ